MELSVFLIHLFQYFLNQLSYAWSCFSSTSCHSEIHACHFIIYAGRIFSGSNIFRFSAELQPLFGMQYVPKMQEKRHNLARNSSWKMGQRSVSQQPEPYVVTQLFIMQWSVVIVLCVQKSRIQRLMRVFGSQQYLSTVIAILKEMPLSFSDTVACGYYLVWSYQNFGN